MAKPRVFVSSTYYDLHHIRYSLERFIKDIGYEPVLFEKGDIPFQHYAPPDESCYNEIHACHMLVMIIGGRYGSPTSDTVHPKKGEDAAAPKDYNSVTKREYQTAREHDIPIFIFVQKNFLAEYDTFKKNRKREQTEWVHVDSAKVFHLLDEILAQPRNNFVRPFEDIDDITSWLRDQWAGLFSGFLSRSRAAQSLNDLASQLLEMRGVVSVLKEYSESIMRKVDVVGSTGLIEAQTKRLREAESGRFAEENLITALVAHCNGEPPSNESLFKAFHDCEDLAVFVIKTGMTSRRQATMLDRWENEAERDWGRLKVKYPPPISP